MRKIIPDWVTVPETRAHRLEVIRVKRPRPDKKEKRNEEMRTQYKDGKTLTELARIYGISRQRVFQIVNEVR